MAASSTPQGVSYTSVDKEYFESRELKRYARAIHIWGLGVGAVISGDYFGWNFGLTAGGFGGLLVATIVIALMYLALSFSIAEMSAALPHTGGAYSFARSAMGPWGGYVTGLAENMEYILTPAVIVVGASGYLSAVFGTPTTYDPLWWLLCYGVFVGLNIVGVEASFRFTLFIAIVALGVLVVFFFAAIPHVDFSRYALDIAPKEGGTPLFPMGYVGILAALPFAIWFFLGIEELPLAAEETVNPQRDIPRGMVLGMVTLIVSSLLVLVINSSIAPGAAAIGSSTKPLYDGFVTVLGGGFMSKLLALLAVAGLIASFHSIIFAYGRQIYSLSRAGYFPPFLSLVHRTRKTPHVALIVGALMGYVAALIIHFEGAGSSLGAMLLNMAVFGAVVSYALQMLSYIMLRVRMPNIERPYKSPTGMWGAVFTGILSIVTLVSLYVTNADYQKGAIAAAIWFALGLVYFAVYGRKRLILSPEEEFAMSQGAARAAAPAASPEATRP
jgi:ethanolamine permease